MGVSAKNQINFFIYLLLFLMVGAASTVRASAENTTDTFVEDIVNTLDKLIGSKAVKDKLAELTKLSGNERQQILILKNPDFTGSIPEGGLNNTTSIVRKIGDATVVVNTTIDSMHDGDGIIITYESELKPPANTTVCKTDTNCSEHHFCHREIFLGLDLRYCLPCSQNGDRCDADSHCCQKSHCRWGRCREDATSGQVGTICGSDGDCEDNECCAMVEGFDEPVCRPLANEGQHCRRDEVSNASMTTNSSSLSLYDKLLGRRNNQSLTFECPCVIGLQCINYGQTFINIFEIPAYSPGGICVPDWAQPDHPVADTLVEITELQVGQISDVIGKE